MERRFRVLVWEPPLTVEEAMVVDRRTEIDIAADSPEDAILKVLRAKLSMTAFTVERVTEVIRVP